MTEPLRPMSTGEVQDRTFTIYRKNLMISSLEAPTMPEVVPAPV